MTSTNRHKSISYTGSDPRTLVQAHDYLVRIRPERGADRLEWLTYYQRSAALYAEIAEIDRGHHHEALYWSGRERAKWDELRAKEGSPQR